MDKSFSRWIQLILIVLVLAGLIAFLISIGDLVRLLVISALLAYILDPLVTRIEAQGLSRTGATVTFYLIVSATVGLALFFLLPLLTYELVEMSDGIDPAKTQLLIQRLDRAIRSVLAFLGLQNFNLTSRLAENVVAFSNSLFSSLLSLVSIFTNLLLTPFIVFFLLKDGRSIKKYLISLVPNRYFELTCNLLYKMDVQLGNYFRGQLLDASVIGILSTLALLILNVKYAFFIGAFAGLANLIPYIGPLSGALLAILITLMETGDFTLAFYIAIAFGIVQLLDNVVVQPTVVARNVNMHPLVVLLVVIIGGKFFGILGMLLSVPVTAIIKVFFSEGFRIYRQYRFS